MLSVWGCNCRILGGCGVNGSHRGTYHTRWIDGWRKGILEYKGSRDLHFYLHTPAAFYTSVAEE